MKLVSAACSALMLVAIGERAAAPAQAEPCVRWEGVAANDYTGGPVAISPGGDHVATLGTYGVQVWQASEGKRSCELAGPESWLRSLVFSPDGNYLAASDWYTLFVWRTSDWTLAYTLTNVGSSIAFSPDSATLAVGGSSSIELRRAVDGARKQGWATEGSGSVRFSPDGTKIAAGRGVRGMGVRLEVWNVADGSLRWSVPTAQSYGVASVAFSPDGEQVLSGGSEVTECWRVSDGVRLRELPGRAFAMAFSPDGAVLVLADEELAFLRFSDGALIARYGGDAIRTYASRNSVAFDPTGGVLFQSRAFGHVLALRTPMLVAAPVMENGSTVIEWVGGGGRFQLQRSLEPNGGWRDEGDVLTARSATVPFSGPKAFYRVINLP